ncbi:Nop52-domain-containing protein [Parathielavia hyrcaniae]|uniref:Nop52-domain-containing protein n=1 Tax=Parathielavia hyrcaniae TaxID=113614 RepID=A0AAN6PXP4_9PEZI|nr:Nop52-domain-containing protein [Parathielavia hyrcaniae]
MASQERSMPFIKNLASSDRKTRTTALSSLHAFLSDRDVASRLTALDVLKLWKGLFYALWMCDRAVPQQALCAELAGLVHRLPRGAVAHWLRGFWATMAREWTGVDVLRMDKFLLLVRRVVGAGFGWMRKGSGEKKEKSGNGSGVSDWDPSKVDDILGLLGEWPFSLEEEARIEQESEEGEPLTQKIPAGLRLHVLDIWVDEAEKAGLLEDDDEEAGQIIQRISDQIDALEEATTSPAVRVRSKESLADERLPGNRKPESEAQEEEGPGRTQGNDWDGFDD